MNGLRIDLENGRIKQEANAGGTMAVALACLGYRALVFEGKAPEGRLFSLVIDSSGKGPS